MGRKFVLGRAIPRGAAPTPCERSHAPHGKQATTQPVWAWPLGAPLVFHQHLHTMATPFKRRVNLTPREKQYIVLVCRSPEPSTEEIAQFMGCEPKTAENHRANAYRKLRVHTRLEMYFKALELGLVQCWCSGRDGVPVVDPPAAPFGLPTLPKA